ncbi:MAG: class I SAM-dependent methyltransferase [Cyanobacteria bacterium P01_F01_bin.143]
MNSIFMSRFEGQGSQDYDSRIQKLIPGYSLLQQLTAAKLQSLFQSSANFLIVGAGTGSETITLAKTNPLWTFMALDISEDMLKIAQQNFANKNLQHRVKIHHGEISTLASDILFDAAICLFVMHFLPHNGEKHDFLLALNQKLKPGCFLFIADLMKPLSALERRSQAMMSQQLGLTPEKSQQMLERLDSDFYPLSQSEFEHLANKTYFAKPIQYFQAFGFHAHMLKNIA